MGVPFRLPVGPRGPSYYNPKEFEMVQGLSLPAAAPLSLSLLLINLSIGAILALVLRWHFKRFGSTFLDQSRMPSV